MQGWMRGVSFQQFEVFSGDCLYTFRQFCKEVPETAAGAMHSQILETTLGFLFAGLTDQEIELPCV